MDGKNVYLLYEVNYHGHDDLLCVGYSYLDCIKWGIDNEYLRGDTWIHRIPKSVREHFFITLNPFNTFDLENVFGEASWPAVLTDLSINEFNCMFRNNFRLECQPLRRYE